MVKTTYFNIYDLIDASCADEGVLSFDTEEQLHEHMNSTRQWFNTDTQSLSDLLLYLLRHIIATPNSNIEVHIELFFAQYYPFQYHPSQPVMAEFYRLCEVMGWTRRYRGSLLKSEEQKAAKEGIQSAIAKTFNDTFGVDTHDLRSWQKLCRALRLDPVPTNLSECHKVSNLLRILL